MIWYPKSPQKIDIVRKNHEQYKEWCAEQEAELKASEDAEPKPGKSIHELTHERLNPRGKAIKKSLKGK